MFGWRKPPVSRLLANRRRSGQPPRIVTVAGMRQLGSTLIYNILRMVYEAKGIDYDCGFVLRFDDMDKSKPLLVKSHEFDARVHGEGVYIINMVRDVRDTVASRFRRYERIGRVFARKDGADAAGVAREQVALHAAFTTKARFELVYEDYKQRPEHVIGMLCADLFGAPDVEAVRTAIVGAENLYASDNIPMKSRHGDKQGFDRHLLSKSHVTNAGAVGGYADTLRKDEIAAIEKVCGRWLRAYGYKTGQR